jgi:non-lysosomal glucosylceramidase
MAHARGRSFTGPALAEVVVPLGGIGTGSIGLTGSGGLAEWQLFGRPDQDSFNPHSFFALWAKPVGRKAVARVLERPLLPPYGRHQRTTGGQRWPGGGLGNALLPGLPHVPEVVFRNQFPLARLDYQDAALPVTVALEAWSPFVPHDAEGSSVPAAVFEFRITNPGPRAVKIALAATVRNPFPVVEGRGGPRNRPWQEPSLRGIWMDHPDRPAGDPRQGSLLLATPWADGFRRTAWRRLAWFDSVQDWWEGFQRTGTLDEVVHEKPGRDADPGTLGLTATVKPGGSVVLPVWIAWSVPTQVYDLAPVDEAGHEIGVSAEKPRWTKHYAKAFPDAGAVVRHLRDQGPAAAAGTRAFSESLLATTVDPAVRDALQANLAILRSPTLLRLPDGTLWGFEGSHRGVGSCPGSCMHVWNSNQAVPLLFPALERGMREAEFRHSFSPTGNGAMAFRLRIPLGQPPVPVTRPAADAQFGVIIRTYAAWRMGGDPAWLAQVWPGVRAALEFAWRYWDQERCGIISGPHHNTYDIEFHGPDPMATGYYLAALEAGARMAEAQGAADLAATYRAVGAAGARTMDRTLFNGQYYEQRIDPQVWPRAEFPHPPLCQSVPGRTDQDPDHQFGTGCLADQLVGQWLGWVAGLGSQLDGRHVDRSLASIVRHNFRTDLSDHVTVQRCFALNDEAGLLLCTWPRGGRPVFPFVYCDEVWPGCEYQVASHAIARGRMDEGLALVRAVRDRHDGIRRNPFNEYECGSWYVRSLASWALLAACSGADHDGIAGRLTFAPPVRPARFSTFWSSQAAWGTITITRDGADLRVLGGHLRLQTLHFGGRGSWRVVVDGTRVTARSEPGGVALAEARTLSAGMRVRVVR